MSAARQGKPRRRALKLYVAWVNVRHLTWRSFEHNDGLAGVDSRLPLPMATIYQTPQFGSVIADPVTGQR